MTDDAAVTLPPPLEQKKDIESSASRWWIAPAVAALASGIIGGVLLQQAGAHHAQLVSVTGPPISAGDEAVLISQGKSLQTGGWVGVSFAIVFVAVAVVMGIRGT